MDWFVYILECADGSLYTGITNNVERRVAQHNSNNRTGAKFTRVRRPVMLVYKEGVKTRSEALKREHQIKKLSKEQKEKLISGPVAQR